jgi:hypothetical protein
MISIFSNLYLDTGIGNLDAGFKREQADLKKAPSLLTFHFLSRVRSPDFTENEKKFFGVLFLPVANGDQTPVRR